MRTLVWTLIGLAALYAFYVGAMSLWTYLEVQSAAEVSVAEKASADRFSRADGIRTELLRRIAIAGVAVDAGQVLVSDEGDIVRVAVRWQYPAIAWGGTTYLVVPLSYHRAFAVPER